MLHRPDRPGALQLDAAPAINFRLNELEAVFDDAAGNDPLKRPFHGADLLGSRIDDELFLQLLLLQLEDGPVRKKRPSPEILQGGFLADGDLHVAEVPSLVRSEERRVGKEGRSR